ATTTSNTKDVLEDRLNALVCDGRVSLFQAQFAISSNWVTAYQTYVGALPSPVGSSGPPTASEAWCQASASPTMDGYSRDYDVVVHSNQPDMDATASDATDSWSDVTNGSGSVDIRLYYTSPGASITVTVGAATCTTTA
ncbi:MAG: hypothetical protein ACRDVW_03655, partial [Acidimicrobiales bacterium]